MVQKRSIALGKNEYAIPVSVLAKFKQEARFVLPESLVGTWVFPPDFISADIAKQLADYTIVAIPNKMLTR